MPSGSLSAVERIKLLSEVKELVEQGKSDNQIANELGVTLGAVKRSIKYIEELSQSVLTTEEIRTARSEVDNQFLEAEEEARKLFYEALQGYPVIDKNGSEVLKEDGTLLRKIDRGLVEKFHRLWTETSMKRAVIYGLDKIKQDNFIQVNTQNNNYVDDIKLSKSLLDKIADQIVEQKSVKSDGNS